MPIWPLQSAQPPTAEIVYRHALAVRITHWVNALCLLVLLLSGLQIFNAHSTLYFGEKSTAERAVLEHECRPARRRQLRRHHHHRLDDVRHDRRAWGCRAMQAASSTPAASRAGSRFPRYRDLATGRRWHFFFAWLFVLNGLAYLAYAAWSGHVRRDLAPTRSQLRHIGQSVWEHIRFRFPKGEEAKQLQRAAEARLPRR